MLCKKNIKFGFGNPVVEWGAVVRKSIRVSEREREREKERERERESRERRLFAITRKMYDIFGSTACPNSRELRTRRKYIKARTFLEVPFSASLKILFPPPQKKRRQKRRQRKEISGKKM